ncbi:hypothetical protein JNB88_09435 [Rhizobium cauense]|uniref:hypothetical protein n=1 Tax=Rhizobium cauense TaxID=1166683 RepID=UPI001C6DD860|nr:hypothetical protein [Rhizobium cauense]MBW9113857.1 hypothetical protein [Rhizobium cauense]
MAKRPPRSVHPQREVCALTALSRQTIFGLRQRRLFSEGWRFATGRTVWPEDVIHPLLFGKLEARSAGTRRRRVETTAGTAMQGGRARIQDGRDVVQSAGFRPSVP